MTESWLKDHDKGTLQRYTGTLAQVAGLQPFSYADGRLRGMRGINGWTGSGLTFTLWPDRALDIGPASFSGKPVAWQHPAAASPAFFEPSGLGWLRTFGGGLLTTCGLVHIGAPDEHRGQSFGLHGRIAHLPAENLRLWQEWRGKQYVLIVEGEVRQAVLFGENLCLYRRIETQLGSTCLHIRDRVVNEGHLPQPHSLLYHCNFGFPLVNPTSRLVIEDEKVEPRTPAAQAGLPDHTRFQEPEAGYEEQVFFHTPKKDAGGTASAALFNPDLNYGVRLRWSADTLPILTEWKMMGEGEYVCGLEPATHAMASWEKLAERGLPRVLEPGESVEYTLDLNIIFEL